MLNTLRWSLLILVLVATSISASTITVESLNRFDSSFSIGKTQVTVNIRDSVLNQKKQMLLDWVIQSAQTVEHYYGRFPVDNLRINLEVSGR